MIPRWTLSWAKAMTDSWSPPWTQEDAKAAQTHIRHPVCLGCLHNLFSCSDPYNHLRPGQCRVGPPRRLQPTARASDIKYNDVLQKRYFVCTTDRLPSPKPEFITFCQTSFCHVFLTLNCVIQIQGHYVQLCRALQTPVGTTHITCSVNGSRGPATPP